MTNIIQQKQNRVYLQIAKIEQLQAEAESPTRL
jgi:hypothetical protein